MKKIFVKILIVSSQIGLFSAFFVFAFEGNRWLIIHLLFPFGIYWLMAMTDRLNCIHCSTPLWDSRTSGRWIPVSPNVVDKCGECGRGLFE